MNLLTDLIFGSNDRRFEKQFFYSTSVSKSCLFFEMDFLKFSGSSEIISNARKTGAIITELFNF